MPTVLPRRQSITYPPSREVRGAAHAENRISVSSADPYRKSADLWLACKAGALDHTEQFARV
jgi:hypothetical protein